MDRIKHLMQPPRESRIIKHLTLIRHIHWLTQDATYQTVSERWHRRDQSRVLDPQEQTYRQAECLPYRPRPLDHQCHGRLDAKQPSQQWQTRCIGENNSHSVSVGDLEKHPFSEELRIFMTALGKWNSKQTTAAYNLDHVLNQPENQLNKRSDYTEVNALYQLCH